MNELVWLDDVSDAERWTVSGARFDIGSAPYLVTMQHWSTSERFCIRKPPALVEATVELLRPFQQANIVELGISQGGSTTLTAQVADPRKLVAVELAPDPVEPLERFIDESGARDRIRPYYGVDQGDRDRLHEIVDREFGGEALDLVVDDASHLLAESRVSFEVLFPRLRSGGLYVIEDWNWEHLRAEAIRRNAARPASPAKAAIAARMRANAQASDPTPRARVTPLTTLVMELLLLRASSGDIVDELTAKHMWAYVRRGPAPLDPDGFRVAAYVQDPFGQLPAAPGIGE